VPAELAQLAPLGVLAGWAWAWYGVAPRWATLAWTGPGVAVAVGYFGDLMDLPRWLQACSPYEHLAAVPREDFRWPPVVVTLLVGLVLAGVGRAGLLARDLS
jgi:ABC-2 type transport system permease protein